MFYSVTIKQLHITCTTNRLALPYFSSAHGWCHPATVGPPDEQSRCCGRRGVIIGVASPLFSMATWPRWRLWDRAASCAQVDRPARPESTGANYWLPPAAPASQSTVAARRPRRLLLPCWLSEFVASAFWALRKNSNFRQTVRAAAVQRKAKKPFERRTCDCC